MSSLDKERAHVSLDPDVVIKLRKKRREFGTDTLSDTVLTLLEREQTLMNLAELVDEQDLVEEAVTG